MIDRLTHSMQALQQLMRAQEVTANNMANLNTPGFKADKLFYHSYIEQIEGQNISKTVPRQTIDMQQGHFEPTGNPFDLAIEGEGFFKVELDGQELLTRNGRFRQNADGFLVNEQGALLLGQNGPVFIPPMEQTANAENEVRMEITKEGNMLIDGAMQDKIELVSVNRFENLKRHSSGYFSVLDDIELIPDDNSSIMQGYYEAGNVSPLKEMTEMMSSAHLFEAQQRAITTTDELLSRATNSLGKF